MQMFSLCGPIVSISQKCTFGDPHRCHCFFYYDLLLHRFSWYSAVLRPSHGKLTAASFIFVLIVTGIVVPNQVVICNHQRRLLLLIIIRRVAFLCIFQYIFFTSQELVLDFAPLFNTIAFRICSVINVVIIVLLSLSHFIFIVLSFDCRPVSTPWHPIGLRSGA